MKDDTIIDMYLLNPEQTLETDMVQDITAFSHEKLNSSHVLYTIERLLYTGDEQYDI